MPNFITHTEREREREREKERERERERGDSSILCLVMYSALGSQPFPDSRVFFVDFCGLVSLINAKEERRKKSKPRRVPIYLFIYLFIEYK